MLNEEEPLYTIRARSVGLLDNIVVLVTASEKSAVKEGLDRRLDRVKGKRATYNSEWKDGTLRYDHIKELGGKGDYLDAFTAIHTYLQNRGFIRDGRGDMAVYQSPNC